MKKALRETQTLRTGCSKTTQKFSPPAHTPSLGRRTVKINQLEKVTHYLYLQTEFGENRCTQFRVIVVTDPHTNNAPPATDRTDNNTLRR